MWQRLLLSLEIVDGEHMAIGKLMLTVSGLLADLNRAR